MGDKKIEFSVNDLQKIDRIMKIIDQMGFKSNAEFANLVGIRETHWSSIKNHNRSFGPDLTYKILVSIPNINPRWLEYGEGEMLRTQSDEQPRCAASEGSATEIELLRSAIRDKEERIEELKERIEDLKENQLLLRDRISFLEAEVAHYESASGVAAAAG